MQKDSIWQNKNYMLLWSGQVISSIGGTVSLIAYPLFVLSITHSLTLTGIVSALRSLGYVVCMLPAGVAIDRLDRKKVMIWCEIGRALCVGSIPFAAFFGNVPFFQLCLVSFFEGALYVFFNVAETSCLPHVVSKAQIRSATVQNQATTSITEVAGPSLAAILYTLSALTPFLVDFLSYIASIVTLSQIKIEFQEKRSHRERHFFSEVFDAIRWIWQRPLLRSTALLTGGIYFAVSGQTMAIITQTQHQVEFSSSLAVGIILSTGGIGSIVGAAVTPYVQHKWSIGATIIIICWATTFLWILYIIPGQMLLLCIITGVISFFIPIYNITLTTYRLQLIPDHLRGRVNSIILFIANLCLPIGTALFSALIGLAGVSLMIIISSGLLVCLSLFALLDPAIRKAPRIDTLNIRINDKAEEREQAQDQMTAI